MIKKKLKARLLDLQSEFTGLESFLYSKIEKLKKENEDIKKALSLCNASNSFNKVQLNKAKEIINSCVDELQIILLHKIRNEERIASILDKAEQFLGEVE